jgi:hypothetical protein
MLNGFASRPRLLRMQRALRRVLPRQKAESLWNKPSPISYRN